MSILLLTNKPWEGFVEALLNFMPKTHTYPLLNSKRRSEYNSYYYFVEINTSFLPKVIYVSI